MKDGMRKSLYKSVIYGIIIFMVCSSILIAITHATIKIHKQEDNIKAMQNVNDVVRFFEETIKSKLNLLKGYQAYIISLEKVSKTLSDELTVVYLDHLLEEDELILNIGIIKDTTMLFVYPQEGNEAVINVDLAKVESNRESILKVKETLEPVFIGPLDLVQGGKGYIARAPFISEGEYWGQISIVLKADEVNSVFQEYAQARNLNVAMYKKDQSPQSFIFGDPSIINDDHLTETIQFFDSEYILAISAEHDVLLEWLMPVFYGISIVFSLIFGILFAYSHQKNIQVKKQANIDGLTNLFNRRYLDYYEENIFNVDTKDKLIGIIVLDVDQFKAINDHYGHHVGDEVLKHIANELTAMYGKQGAIFRLGGDEFLIVFANLNAVGEMDRISAKMEKDLTQEFNYQEYKIPIIVSIGQAVYPKEGHDFNTVMRIADDRMYLMKNQRQEKNRGASE